MEIWLWLYYVRVQLGQGAVRASRTGQLSSFFGIKCGSSMLPYLFGYTSLRQIHKIYLFFILLYCSFALFALWRLVLYVLQYDSMYLLDESSSLVFFILFLIIQQILGQFNLRHINQKDWKQQQKSLCETDDENKTGHITRYDINPKKSRWLFAARAIWEMPRIVWCNVTIRLPRHLPGILLNILTTFKNAISAETLKSGCCRDNVAAYAANTRRNDTPHGTMAVRASRLPASLDALI